MKELTNGFWLPIYPGNVVGSVSLCHTVRTNRHFLFDVCAWAFVCWVP